MLVVQLYPAIPAVHNVVLLLVQQVALAVDVVGVVSQGNFYLSRLGPVFAYFEAFNEPQQDGRGRTLYGRGLEVGQGLD